MSKDIYRNRLLESAFVDDSQSVWRFFAWAVLYVSLPVTAVLVAKYWTEQPFLGVVVSATCLFVSVGMGTAKSKYLGIPPFVLVFTLAGLMPV